MVTIFPQQKEALPVFYTSHLSFLLLHNRALTSLFKRRTGLLERYIYQATVLIIGSELAREKTWARIHLIPLLQAEEDRDQVRRYFADRAREKELVGTEIKVYNSDRFVRPTFAYTPAQPTQ
ncbi:hypothetical protein CISG_10353 [Coccidioides immitis RMSCC 3703]|uniref:Uncharacterized protein n=1 Tax=Coccidioides immitis RMSCC 3703 TaxID=454286 RepID=A0A0J8TNH2_COCIT|nr:hypothetical protein CISG_10353 [Coccidioides immitis RMSCC 3703]